MNVRMGFSSLVPRLWYLAPLHKSLGNKARFKSLQLRWNTYIIALQLEQVKVACMLRLESEQHTHWEVL